MPVVSEGGMGVGFVVTAAKIFRKWDKFVNFCNSNGLLKSRVGYTEASKFLSGHRTLRTTSQRPSH